MTSSADDDFDADSGAFPLLEDGEQVQIVAIKLDSKKTKPPNAYTEGTLLTDMKAAGKFVTDPALRKMLTRVSGIGTSATRAKTIEELKNDKLISVTGKKLKATERGHALIAWLDQVCPDLTDVSTTAQWEARLDLVEQSGGGAAFERDIAAQVKNWIEILKKAPPPSIPGGGARATQPNSTKERSMTEAKKPTENMVAFASRLAKRLNQQLPSDVLTDFDACRKFIDANKEAGMRPTEKQISFAERIAKEKGVSLPDDARSDSRRISEWIDANK